MGVVDVFYDAKPYVTAEEFRRMQGTRVPLLRAEKFTWTNGETFTGKAQIVNFSDRAVRNGRVEWSLKYPDGRVYRKGGFRRPIFRSARSPSWERCRSRCREFARP